MNKRTKVFIVISASIATSLAFAVPWLLMHMRYEYYSKNEADGFRKKYGYNMSALSGEKLAEASEASEASERNIAITICLNRYRRESLPFATALTDCKQEVLLEQ